MAFDQLDVILVGEVAALVTVNDFRFPIAQCPLQTGQDKAFFQCAGQFIVNQTAAVPAEDDKQLHESFAHLDVRYIDSPNLIWSCYGQVSQQARSHILGVVTLAEIGFRVDRQDPHLPNQALDGLLVDQRIPSEYIGDLAIAVGRIILVDLINLVHDPNGGIVHHSDLGFIVDAAPIDRQQLALSLDCQVRMIAINCGQTFPYGGEFRQIFF